MKIKQGLFVAATLIMMSFNSTAKTLSTFEFTKDAVKKEFSTVIENDMETLLEDINDDIKISISNTISSSIKKDTKNALKKVKNSTPCLAFSE